MTTQRVKVPYEALLRRSLTGRDGIVLHSGAFVKVVPLPNRKWEIRDGGGKLLKVLGRKKLNRFTTRVGKQ